MDTRGFGNHLCVELPSRCRILPSCLLCSACCCVVLDYLSIFFVFFDRDYHIYEVVNSKPRNSRSALASLP